MASAQTPGGETRLEGAMDGEKSPFRGSAINYRNSATAISFDESAELTYNPTWAMSLSLAPRYYFSDMFYAMASIDFTRELTNDDMSTYKGETWIGDLRLRAGATRFLTIPVLDINISGTLDFVFPTSKWSASRTMLFAIQPGLRLSHHFDLLAGLDIGYGINLRKNFNRYTTGETDSPYIAACAGSVSGCDSFYNDGLRNVSWRISDSFDVTLSFADWVSVSASFGFIHSFLYDGVTDDTVNYTPVEPTDVRTALFYDVGATFIPLSYLWVTVGASTFNPQQAPDSSNYAPFFNRFTSLYLDLRLDVADLIATATR
ncbi:MAG: hypothetical protein EP329_14645 [Deltaproteobacteria bacterium]|nr:MAG: hypothetical protein EP329_14645 [Deltaproteobacteria bacterium]